MNLLNVRAITFERRVITPFTGNSMRFRGRIDTPSRGQHSSAWMGLRGRQATKKHAVLPRNHLNPYFVSNASFLTASLDDTTGKKPFLLADIGEGIKEVEILQWFVQPGDAIHQFDKVCEVQSDKATVEITSRYDGVVLELAGDVGDMLQVGHPLLYMQSDESIGSNRQSLEKMVLEDSDAHPDETRLSIPSIASNFRLESDHPSNVSGKVLTSPAVRHIGRQYNVDLNTISGTGPQGRILKADIQTYLKENGLWRDEPRKQESVVQPIPSTEASLQISPSFKVPLPAASQSDKIVKLKGYNRLMVKTMTAALQTPHMCFGDEWNLDKLMACRQDLKDIGSNISLLTLLIKACSLSLHVHPMVNASVHSIDDEELLLRKNHDIGVAVDTSRGLVVPVIRCAQDMSLQEIQDDLDRLKALARENKLGSKDLESPSFTLSNIGSFGGTYMHPIIVPPQICMGAIGQIQRLPRFDKNDNVYAARVMTVSWAGDHRFLDGATLARFNATYKGFVENPVRILTGLQPET